MNSEYIDIARPPTWKWSTVLWWPLLAFISILLLFAVFNIDHGLQDWLINLTVSFLFSTAKFTSSGYMIELKSQATVCYGWY